MQMNLRQLLSSANQGVRTADQLSHVQRQICDFIAEQVSKAEIRSLISDDLLGLAKRAVPLVLCFTFHQNLVLKSGSGRDVADCGSHNQICEEELLWVQPTQRHVAAIIFTEIKFLFTRAQSHFYCRSDLLCALHLKSWIRNLRERGSPTERRDGTRRTAADGLKSRREEKLKVNAVCDATRPK